MLRLLLIVVYAATLSACTWPFAEAKKQSVGTDFEYQDFTPVTNTDKGDGSIAWES